MASKNFFGYSVDFKNFFFDRPRVINNLDKKAFRVMYWFGSAAREKTRDLIGTPKVTGAKVKTKSGKERRRKYRKPRPAGRPPIARVADPNKGGMTIRNIQYNVKRFKSGNTYGRVQAGAPIFAGGQRHGSKSIPEILEFGGLMRIRSKFVDVYERTKSGRKRKFGNNRDTKTKKVLIFSKKFAPKTFTMPKRPFLRPGLVKAYKRTEERVRRGGLK